MVKRDRSNINKTKVCVPHLTRIYANGETGIDFPVNYSISPSRLICILPLNRFNPFCFDSQFLKVGIIATKHVTKIPYGTTLAEVGSLPFIPSSLTTVALIFFGVHETPAAVSSNYVLCDLSRKYFWDV